MPEDPTSDQGAPSSAPDDAPSEAPSPDRRVKRLRILGQEELRAWSGQRASGDGKIKETTSVGPRPPIADPAHRPTTALPRPRADQIAPPAYRDRPAPAAPPPTWESAEPNPSQPRKEITKVSRLQPEREQPQEGEPKPKGRMKWVLLAAALTLGLVALVAWGRGQTRPQDFLRAVEEGRTEQVVRALGQRSDWTLLHDGGGLAAFNVAGRLVSKPRPPWPPLHLAAQAGHAGVAQALLKAGAPVDARDGEGGTALLVASLAGRTEMVRLLQGFLANPDLADRRGQTPLMAAVVSGQAEVVDLLLAQGANPRQAAWDGTTALHLAAAHGQEAMIRSLLAKGGQARAADLHGRTPLTVALQGGRAAAAVLLRQ